MGENAGPKHYNVLCDTGLGVLERHYFLHNSGSPMATTPSKDHKRREREQKKMYKRQAREEAKVAKRAEAELAAAEAVKRAADEKQAQADAEFEAEFAREMEAEAEAAKKSAD